MECLRNFCKPPENKYLFLFFGAFLGIFTIGRINIPIFIFIWPFLLLHYMHNDPNRLRGILLTLVALIASSMLRFIGFTDIKLGDDIKQGCFFSIIHIIPFLIDGIFYATIDRWKSVILFPLLVSAFEFFFSLMKYANMNPLAYGLFDNLIFTQMMSLFGIYSLSFMIALFASVLDYSLYLYYSKKRASRWIFAYIIAVLVFYVYGALQLRLEPIYESVKVACASGISNAEYNMLDYQVIVYDDYTFEWEQTEFDGRTYKEYFDESVNYAVTGGAQLLMFAEEAFYILDTARDYVIDYAAKAAKLNKTKRIEQPLTESVKA